MALLLLRDSEEALVAGRIGRALPAGEIVRVVEDALGRTEDLLGIAVCSHDGLPIADAFTGRHDAVAVAAMAELIRRSGAKVFEHLGYEGPESVVMHGSDADIVVRTIRPHGTVIAVAEPESNLGMVQIVLRDLAEDLRALFEE